MAPEESDRKIQRSSTLPKSLVDRARNAVYWTRNVPGEPGSFSALVEKGMRAEVERLETTYNEGRPFDDGELRPGPAPGVMEKVAEMRRRRREQESEGPSDEASGARA